MMVDKSLETTPMPTMGLTKRQKCMDEVKEWLQDLVQHLIQTQDFSGGRIIIDFKSKVDPDEDYPVTIMIELNEYSDGIRMEVTHTDSESAQVFVDKYGKEILAALATYIATGKKETP